MRVAIIINRFGQSVAAKRPSRLRVNCALPFDILRLSHRAQVTDSVHVDSHNGGGERKKNSCHKRCHILAAKCGKPSYFGLGVDFQ